MNSGDAMNPMGGSNLSIGPLLYDNEINDNEKCLELGQMHKISEIFLRAMP